MDPVLSSAAPEKTEPLRRNGPSGLTDFPDASNAAPGVLTEERPAGSAPASAQPTGADGCPKCGSKLVSPEQLGWCPKCGYCRSLEADKGTQAILKPPPVKTSALGAAEFWQLLGRMPFWSRVLLGGMAVIVAVSVAATFLLPTYSLPRALWTSIALGVSFLVFLAAEVWSLLLIAPTQDDLGARDLVLFRRLWALTLKRLPETHKQVWLGSWAVTTVVCSLFIVGGIDYWYQFYQPKKQASKDLLMAAAMALAKNAKADDKSLTEAVEDLAKKADLEKKKIEVPTGKVAGPNRDIRPTVQCAIIGYTLNEKDDLSGLVIATLESDRLRYAGVVDKGFTREKSQDLLKRLSKLKRPDPLIKGLSLSAVWVQPRLFCEVHQSGYDDQRKLKNPAFGNLLEDQ